MKELRKLEQGELPIERYERKYHSLVHRSPLVDRKLLYNWFIEDLLPRKRRSATSWTRKKEMRAERVELAHMEYPRGKNATSTALTEEEDSKYGKDLDSEPVDTEVVNPRPAESGQEAVTDS
ncbi:uncharacterized protein EMH_0016910 [Eimeria mitis]|uniref:Uncharacterized protein n=1 Tax=Eimeria mitis TaxID=44415 RepID=U6JZ16_9EIME|nr:uncharacterized protein EMH_0016910 [Eimeria mitis]CDJ28763.1 hypothetical protein EMH_0016910 [Eimeria mitis]